MTGVEKEDYMAAMTASAKARGAAGAADVAGEGLAFGVDLFEGGLDLFGGVGFVEVVEHEDGGLQQGGGVGLVLAGDVGGGAVDGFEDGALVAEVGAGDEAEAADEGRSRGRRGCRRRGFR